MKDPQKTQKTPNSDPQKTQKTQAGGPLAEIKQLYFRASCGTIVRDFDRAIDLLKSLPSEDDRERATVFMQGLAEMKKQWHGERPGVRASGSARGRESGRPKFGVPSAKSRARGSRAR